MTKFMTSEVDQDNGRPKGDFVTWEQNLFLNLDKHSPQKRKDALNTTLSISTLVLLPIPKHLL